MTGAPPLSLVLSNVPWRVFATLTFRAEVSEHYAWRELERWLKWCAHVSRIRYARLLSLSRMERGERFGRLHLHVLIGEPVASQYFVLLRGRVSAAHRAWRNGLTRYRYVEQENDLAVVYALKGLNGADMYELKKTGRASDVVLSPWLWRLCYRASHTQPVKGTTTRSTVNPPVERQAQAFGKTGCVRDEERFIAEVSQPTCEPVGVPDLGSTARVKRKAWAGDWSGTGQGVIAPVTRWIETATGIFKPE